MDYAFQYIEDNGITTDRMYPYRAVQQSCKYERTKEEIFKVTGWVDVPQKSSKQLMAAVLKNPVSVAIDAEGMDF